MNTQFSPLDTSSAFNTFLFIAFFSAGAESSTLAGRGLVLGWRVSFTEEGLWQLPKVRRERKSFCKAPTII